MSSMLSEIAQEEIEMEMTPMIDVTFLLLIFFLCTLKFKVLEGKLAAYLPKDVGVNSTQAEPVEKVEVFIQVIKPGVKVFPEKTERAGERFQPDPGNPELRYEYSGRELKYILGPRSTKELKSLDTWIKEAFRLDDEAPSTINCAPDATYGDIVPVLDCLVDAGFEKITFAGEIKTKKKK